MVTEVTKIIEDRIVRCKVGDIVQIDTGRHEKLLPCDDWDKAQFRWPNPIQGWEVKHAIALNIEITGRSFQRRQGDYYVRVKMIWVGDCEPDTIGYGWLKVNPWHCDKSY